MKLNGIKHVHCAPYHLTSNVLAECFIQSLKLALKANVSSGLVLEHCLSNPLGVSLASLFLHRPVWTCLDLVRPDVESQVLSKQADQKVLSLKTCVQDLTVFLLL